MLPVPSAPLFTSCIVMTRHHLFTFFNYTTVGVSWTRPRRLFAWSPVHSVLHIVPYLVYGIFSLYPVHTLMEVSESLHHEKISSKQIEWTSERT